MARPGGQRSSIITLALVLALAVLVVAVWAFVIVDHRRASAPDTSARASAGASSTGSTKGAAADEGTGGQDSGRQAAKQTMEQARTALAGEDPRVLVLGDSTGDGPDEWVRMWAESEGLYVSNWQEGYYAGASEETRLWNASMQDEATADDALEQWDTVRPDNDPDVVLLSYGHYDDSGDEATESLAKLHEQLEEDLPDAKVVVVLQNPEADDANAPVREAIGTWAKGAGLPTIDVAAAFEESDLSADDLRLTEKQPSEAGQELWVETVQEALG